jgi:thioredoxin 1
MKKVNKDNFEEEVVNSNKVVLIKFGAPWCGACGMMDQILEQVEGGYENLKMVEINIENNQELAEEYKVSSLPTIVFLKDNNEKNRFSGVVSINKIKNTIKSLLE